MLLPVAYLMLKFGQFPPQSVFYVSIVMSLFAVVGKLYFGWKLVGISPWKFILNSILPVFFVMVLSITAGCLVRSFLEQGLLRLILVTGTSIMMTAISVLTFGMTAKERSAVIERIRRFRV